MPDDHAIPGRLSEAEVVYWLKRGLIRRGLAGRSVRDIVVDADANYVNSPFKKRLEPMGTVWIGSWRPDLICRVEDRKTEHVVGFEVKARSDYEKGIVQASRYRAGVHEAYLCLPTSPTAAQMWIRTMATRNGVGLALAATDSLAVEVPPAGPMPDPGTLRHTERYLLGQSVIRSFGLNKPLHYAAAAFACAFVEDPWRGLVTVWGLDDSAVRDAFRGAETLGLLAGGSVTTKGVAFVEVLRALGFCLETMRYLTRKRLLEHEPGIAALLRSVMLDYPPIDLIMRVLLLDREAPLTVIQLAQRAEIIDDGMASAVFGSPPAPGEPWRIRPSTRFKLKAAMYDVGLLDSGLARGSGGGWEDRTYVAETDLWILGQASLSS
jgi:hypothetical protein